jgi:hypothetical protein
VFRTRFTQSTTAKKDHKPMSLSVPPNPIRNALLDRDEWRDFVGERALLWERRLADLGPDELRDARDALERRIQRSEEEAEKVLEEAGDLAREISGYADLDEEESVRRLRRIVMGVPREMPLTLDGEPVDLWEAQDVFSEAAPGNRKLIKRLVRHHSRIRRKIQQEKFSLHVVEHVHGQYLRGALTLGGSDEPLDPTDTDLPSPTAQYLEAAHKEIESGDHPSGDKPTELWKAVADATGKEPRNVRETFRNRDWYRPYGTPTPLEYTIRAVQEAFEEHFR